MAGEQGLGILFRAPRPFSEVPGPQGPLAFALLGIQQMPGDVKGQVYHLGDSLFQKRLPHIQWS